MLARPRILLLLVILLTLTACQFTPIDDTRIPETNATVPPLVASREVDCAALFSPTLLALELDKMPISDVRAILEAELGVTSAQDYLVEYGDKAQVMWLDSEHRNLVHFADGVVKRITVSYEDRARRPAADFISCFGEPALYDAAILRQPLHSASGYDQTVPYLAIDLWYPDTGMLVKVGQFLRTMDLPPIDDALIVSAVSRVEPGDAAHLIRNRYTTALVVDPPGVTAYPELVNDYIANASDEFLAAKAAALRPWTGWADMKVTNCFEEACPDVFP